MPLAEQAKLAVTLDLKGNFTSGVGKAARALQGLDRSTSRTQQSLSKFGRNIERGILLGTTAAVTGFVAVAKAAGDFEAQLNTIGTIVDRGQLGKIGEDLRKTARDTGLSLDDLTAAYYDLASAGVKGQLATDALNDAVKLGIGGLATTAETVDLLTTAINAYKLDSVGAAKATDQFALAVQDGKVKASEIAASFADVASIAKTYKIGIDQIAASYAFLTAQGVPAGEVTTEMQRAIVSLINPTKDLETAQKKLGISFTKEIATKGLVGALQELRQYSDKTGIPLIALLGRIEAVKYTLQTTGPSFKGYNAELDKMGKASGTAAAQMAERQQGLNFQLARLKALARDAGITIGSALLPKLTPLVEKLNTFISANQGKIAQFGSDLASGFEKLATAIGKVDWQPFIDGLRISSDIAKKAIDLFMSLPDGLKTAVIGGFAVNKLTGGLPAALVKDAGGAVLDRFARGSSPANPLWVASVGGIGGGGSVIPLGPGAAAAGGLGLGTIAAGLAAGTAISALGIMGLGWLIEATSSPEQFAETNRRAQQQDLFKRSGGKLGSLPGTPAGTKTNPLFVAQGQTGGLGVAATLVQPLITALNSVGLGRVTAGGFDSGFGRSNVTGGGFDSRFGIPGNVTPGGFDKRIVDAFTAATRAMSKSFYDAVKGLKTAHTPAEVRKAVAAALAVVIGQRRGNALATGRVLADLKGQLVHTTDPTTRKILQQAIHQVEHKLAGRALVQKQLDKADKIAKSSESTKDKLRDLTAIQKGLAHTSKSGQDKIQAKIDALKAEAQRTTQAVKRKHWSVTIPITANVTTGGFDIRNVIGGATTIRKYGNVTTSVSTRFTNINPPS